MKTYDVKAVPKDILDDLWKLYDYIETGKCSRLTGRIDNAVVEARKKEEWRSSYMKEMVVIMDAKEEGAAEERKNTEAERKRADKAEARATKAESRANKAETELARYKAAFGELT